PGVFQYYKTNGGTYIKTPDLNLIPGSQRCFASGIRENILYFLDVARARRRLISRISIKSKCISVCCTLRNKGYKYIRLLGDNNISNSWRVKQFGVGGS